ncbi:hypothetical protein H0H92_005667, partial [Tricholoma furcatifolium]
GNLRNLHSYKFSGLANAKTIDITDSPAGIQITTRKTTAASGAVKSAFAKSSIRPRSGSRRAQGVVAQYAKRGYRADLRTRGEGKRREEGWHAKREDKANDGGGQDALYSRTYLNRCMKGWVWITFAISTTTRLRPIKPLRARAMSLSGPAALARVSALVAAQKGRKPSPPKKVRGAKAKAAVA